MNIGKNIRRLRREKNMTQEELAENLNVSVSAVSQWETAANLPDVMLSPALASFFGVLTDELFDFN